MQLSSAGKIVAHEWKKTQQIRNRVQLGEWVVMPNHVHGIYLKSKTSRDASHASPETLKAHKKDRHIQKEKSVYKNKFGPQRNNISSIIRGLKSASTRRIRESGTENFQWQSGFYDHIIRNQKSLLHIEQYIRENPYRWFDDRYHC